MELAHRSTDAGEYPCLCCQVTLEAELQAFYEVLDEGRDPAESALLGVGDMIVANTFGDRWEDEEGQYHINHDNRNVTISLLQSHAVTASPHAVKEVAPQFQFTKANCNKATGRVTGQLVFPPLQAADRAYVNPFIVDHDNRLVIVEITTSSYSTPGGHPKGHLSVVLPTKLLKALPCGEQGLVGCSESVPLQALGDRVDARPGDTTSCVSGLRMFSVTHRRSVPWGEENTGFFHRFLHLTDYGFTDEKQDRLHTAPFGGRPPSTASTRPLPRYSEAPASEDPLSIPPGIRLGHASDSTREKGKTYAHGAVPSYPIHERGHPRTTVPLTLERNDYVGWFKADSSHLYLHLYVRTKVIYTDSPALWLTGTEQQVRFGYPILLTMNGQRTVFFSMFLSRGIC